MSLGKYVEKDKEDHIASLFNRIVRSKTPVEECKGFKVIDCKDINDKKACRLSVISNELTAEPYCVEIVEDLRGNAGQIYKCITKTFADESSARAFFEHL